MRIENVTKQSLNADLFEKLCRAKCTYEEIADFMGVSLPCLRKWVYLWYNNDIKYIHERFVRSGNADVRIAKYEAMKDGNWQAIQWEAEQRLGERKPDGFDKQMEDTQNVEDLSPISEMLKDGDKDEDR